MSKINPKTKSNIEYIAEAIIEESNTVPNPDPVIRIHNIMMKVNRILFDKMIKIKLAKKRKIKNE